jgi:hypothetical protein
MQSPTRQERKTLGAWKALSSIRHDPVAQKASANRTATQHPAGSSNRVFVVSQKSEEERTGSLRRTMIWLLVGATVLFAIAAGLGYFAARAYASVG